MRPQDVIRKKRDGLCLVREEIEFFIGGVTNGRIADYQVSALLMRHEWILSWNLSPLVRARIQRYDNVA